MEWSTIFGLAARRVLTGFGGYLGLKGLLGTDPAAIQNFVGAGMVFVDVCWSAWTKYGKVLVDAEVARLKGVPAKAP